MLFFNQARSELHGASVRGLQEILLLRKASKELWLMLIIKFCDSIAFYSLTRIMTLMLSEVFGYDDFKAGTIFGAFGALMNVYGLIAGFFIDKYGVTKIIKLGIFISLVGRTVLLLTVLDNVNNKALLLTTLLFLLPAGSALLNIISIVAMKRYALGENCGGEVGILLSVSNAGYLISGIMVDCFRKLLHEDISASYKAILFTGVVCSFSASPCSAIMDEVGSIKFESTHVTFSENSSSQDLSSSNRLHRHASGSSNENNVESLMDGLKWSNFWRFMILSFIVTNSKEILFHLNSTMPKYLIRTFGQDVPFGLISSINPGLVILLGPIITFLTYHIKALGAILVGIFLTTTGIIFVTVWPDCKWAVILFIITISIGECIWSPRFHELSLLSCKGKEGLFVSLAFVPAIFTKLYSGFLSGYVLGTFCPKYGLCDGRSLWGVILGVSALSPIVMTVLWTILIVDKNSDVSQIEIDRSGSCSKNLTEPLLT